MNFTERGKRWRVNSLFILMIMLIIVGNVFLFQASPSRIGEFVGKSAIIIIGFWFITLFIPKKFEIYNLVSSLSFILLIPLSLSLLFTYESYQVIKELNTFKLQIKTVANGRNNNLNKLRPESINEADVQLLKTANQIMKNFSRQYSAKTQEINALHDDTLVHLNQNINTKVFSNKDGRIRIIELLKSYKNIIRQRRFLYEESMKFLVSQLNQAKITDREFWDAFQKNSNKARDNLNKIEHLDEQYIDW